MAYVLLNACEALAEMALSARLADAVAQGVAASRAQGLATAARWVGSLVASGLSLSIYRCGRAAPRPQYLFRATAAVALVSSVVALGDRGVSSKKASKRLPRVVLVAAIAQAAALGAGGLCGAWVNVGCALVAGLCGFLALSVRGPSNVSAVSPDAASLTPRSEGGATAPAAASATASTIALMRTIDVLYLVYLVFQ